MCDDLIGSDPVFQIYADFALPHVFDLFDDCETFPYEQRIAEQIDCADVAWRLAEELTSLRCEFLRSFDWI